MGHIVRDTKQLGNVLRRKRKELHMTQGHVAELVNVRQSTISDIELGVRCPSLAIIFRLLAVFDLEIQIHPRSKGSAINLEDIF